MSYSQIEEQEKRRLIDLTLTAARKQVSSQTGWVHFCHEGDGTRHDTIPVLENFCLILALFRSRLSEDVLQGRQLLEKLLAFEAHGHFPLYLHEYPHIRDRGLILDLLPIFIHLQREFSSVLGENLETHLVELIARIIKWGEKEAIEEPFSYSRHSKLLAAQGKFRLVPGRKIASSSQLADELISLQLQGGYKDSDLQEITRFWHTGLRMYRGPYTREMQEGFAPAPTMLDYFMGQLFGSYSQRLFAPHPVHLRTALIYPFALRPLQSDHDPYLWIVDAESKAVHLFWESENTTHSFVIQGATSWKALGCSYFAIDCALSDKVPGHGEEKSEVNCFLNYHTGHAIRIGSGRASSFSLHQPLSIRSFPLDIEVQFSVHEGEGKFFGHLLRGNRPRQILTRGEKRFTAYDWQIALRTVARQAACTLRVVCKFDLQKLPVEGGAIDGDPHGMQAVVDVEGNAAHR